MTELDQYKAMLTRAKIEFTETQRPDGRVEINVEGGYIGFVSCHTFWIATGELAEVAAYE